MENQVVVATFYSEDAAMEAAQEIQDLEQSGAIKIKQGAIVTKDADGNVTVPDSTYVGRSWGPVGGGIIGALLGLLLGPAGAAATLGGAAAGILAGAAGDAVSDSASLDRDDELMQEVQSGIEPGQTVLLAELDEESAERVEVAVTRRGGRVFRTSHQMSKVEEVQDQAEHNLAALSDKIDSKIAADEAHRDWEHDRTKEGDIEMLGLVTIDQQSKYDVYANSQGPASTRPLDE